MNEIFIQTTVHGVIHCILDAVKRNGIEKTLEDLQNACEKGSPSNQDIYEGMLLICKETSDVLKEMRKR